MQRLLKVASPFCVYDEWRIRCKSHDTCPDIPIWLKNGDTSHYNIGHCLNIPRGEHIFISVPVFIQGRACYGIKCTPREGERVTNVSRMLVTRM